MSLPHRKQMQGWKFDKARAMRKQPTPAEDILWQALRRKALGCRFHRQEPIFGYIADFYCAQYRFVVECDGRHHAAPPQSLYDAERDSRLLDHGVRTLRLTNTAVIGSLDWCLARIRSLMVTPE